METIQMEKVKNLVPELRFKEFEDIWGVTTFANIADKKSKWSLTGGPFGSDLKSSDYTSSGVRVIQLQNMGDGLFIDENKIYTSTQKADNLISCNIYPGDIILSKMGDPVARACIIPDSNGRYLMCSDGIRLFVDNERFSKYFIFISINSVKFRTEAITKSTGSTRKRIGLKELKEIPVNIPSLLEQQKIASFLSSVDEKIQQLTRKKELLEQYKKGVMQKIFAQELRFQPSPIEALEIGDEYPDWEEKKLGEVIQIQGGFAFKSNLFNKGQTKVIRIGNIEPNIFLDNFDGVYSNEIPDLKYLAKKGDFLMALSGATFGKVGKIKDDGIGYINQRVALFRTKENLEFYNQLVQTVNFRNYINSIPSASAQPNISNGDILNFESSIPCLSEQTKIATFLSAIDEKIEKTTQLLTQTETFKKGLLQKMFV